MKSFYLVVLLCSIGIFTCRTAFAHIIEQDKTFTKLLEKVEQNPNNKNAIDALRATYESLREAHLQNIQQLDGKNSLSARELVLEEYHLLQNMFDAIDKMPTVRSQITTIDYSLRIEELSQQLAEAYYSKGLEYLPLNHRKAQAKAYHYFKSCNALVSNYKDCIEKMAITWGKSSINIMLSTEDGSAAKLNGQPSSNAIEYYLTESDLQNMIPQLDKLFSTKYNTNFSTATAPGNQQMHPDWKVAISLVDFKMQGPNTTLSAAPSDFRSDIKNNNNTTVRDIRYTSANQDKEVNSINATAKIKVNITDYNSGKTIRSATFTNLYKWVSRTDLSTSQIVNDDKLVSIRSNDAKIPTTNEVLNELLIKFNSDISQVLGEEIRK